MHSGGGVLAAINAVPAFYSPRKRRPCPGRAL